MTSIRFNKIHPCSLRHITRSDQLQHKERQVKIYYGEHSIVCILRCCVSNMFLLKVLSDNMGSALATAEIASHMCDQLLLAPRSLPSHGIVFDVLVNKEHRLHSPSNRMKPMLLYYRTPRLEHKSDYPCTDNKLST